MKKFIISESERNQISRLHKNSISNESIAIVEWLSPDEKYCIFLDDLIDIENKKKIGNVFENFDNFRFFLKHCYQTATHLTEELRESLLESVNSFVITESNSDMRGLKPYVKQMILEQEQEWTANPFKKDFYSSQNWKNAYESGKKAVASGVEGLKTAYSNIKDGDWRAAMSIVGKGALYVARKIRSALNNPIGIILDAILVAIGFGKPVQFAIWGVVVMLDLYELSTNNFEEPNLGMGWRYLYIGTDILGMVTAGGVAKASKKVLNTARAAYGSSDDALKLAVQSKPELKGIIKKMLDSSSSASNRFNQVANYTKSNSPMLYKFFKGVINIFGWFLKKFVNLLSWLLKGIGKVLGAPGKGVEALAARTIVNPTAKTAKVVAGTAAAANQFVPMAAVHGYGSYKQAEQEKEMQNVVSNIDFDNFEL
jgi:hypothetical protein